MLRAYGAEVVITPTRSSTTRPRATTRSPIALAEEIPGGFKPDQYSNMANPEAHYARPARRSGSRRAARSTRSSISVGTGGTISGVGRYFKSGSPAC
jgi:cystathionine beta-synthase